MTTTCTLFSWFTGIHFLILLFFNKGLSQPNTKLPFTISDSMLRCHVNALAHDSMMGRMAGTLEIEKAANYIASYMLAYGLEPLSKQKESYFIPISIRLNKTPEKNVIGKITGQGEPDSFIVISAHYDHIGTVSKQVAVGFGQTKKQIKGDSIFNGANDDASGVAAILELARIFSKSKPYYTLIFSAFSMEELGLVGSRDFVETSGIDLLDIKKIKWNFNFEMLGRQGKGKPFVIQRPDERVSDMVPVFNKNIYEVAPDLGKSFFINDPFILQSLFSRSDHYAFFEKGVPSVTFMTGIMPDKYYHSPIDEAKTLEYGTMTNLVQAITWAILPIINPNKLY